MLLGLALRRIGFIDDHFNQIASRLVFFDLFACTAVLPQSARLTWRQRSTFRCSTLACAVRSSLFGLSWVGRNVLLSREKIAGVVVQGAFRSNLGVIGLALCAKCLRCAGSGAGIAADGRPKPFHTTSCRYLFSASMQKTDLNWLVVFYRHSKKPPDCRDCWWPFVCRVSVAFVYQASC